MSGDLARDERGTGKAAARRAEAGPPGGHSGLVAIAGVSASQTLSPLPADLPPEIRDLAETLRVLFGSLNMSLNRLAALLHSDAGTISRYLSGRRMPPPGFIDALCKAVYDARGSLITADVQELVHERFLVALKAHSPVHYEVQRLTDLLQAAAQEKQQYEIIISALRDAIASKNDKLYQLELEGRRLRSSWDNSESLLEEERAHRKYLQQAIGDLCAEVAALKEQLAATQNRAAVAEERCQELEDKLDSAGALLPDESMRVTRADERYRALVQGGAQIIWFASSEGDMLEDSPEWRWITGQTEEEFLGNGWLDSIHPEDRERVERDWRESLRTGRIFDDRFRMRVRAGSYRHYDVRAVPIERDGKIAEWVGACTDVTSQREAEEMRGRLTDQLSAAALRTARLQQATAMLAEALDVEQVVEVITEVGRSAIGALRSAVALLNDDKLGLRVVNRSGLAPAGPDGAGVRLTLDTPSVMTRAIATRRPVLIADPEELRAQFESEPDGDPDGKGRVTDTGDEQAWVGLPLLAAGMPLGALRFSFGKPRTILEGERVFLEALAGQCALAVERAEMYEKEHTAVVTLQRSLMVGGIPTIPGLALAARYQPRTTDVGGDWYDVFQLPDRRLAIAVGDVMGKGLLAAATMGRVAHALRALALTDPRPAAVLAGLDRLFDTAELEEQITTVTYLVIDPETGEAQAGNAGHPPTLLLAPGSPPVLDSREPGTPLCWATPRRQHSFRLPPGSTAVFYSDGLVENRVRGLDSGLDDLLRVAADTPPGLLATPGELLQHLLGNMLAGHQQDDDVTVLVLHVSADL
jgi:PAS domain S-box-containing protein